MTPLQHNQLPTVEGYRLTELLYAGCRTRVCRALPDDGNPTTNGDCIEGATANPPSSVIIKVMADEHPSFRQLVKFRNQYVIAKNLSISGIVAPIELKPWGNGYALVMEDVGGIDLGEYVQSRKLSWQEVLAIALQLADIFHDLHQHRVIHKDIKPANILIQPETQNIRLIDFSIASLLPKESREIQSPNALEGTLAYLAPEQTGRMNRGIDYRTDFYGLGVTLYELLTGERPFHSEDAIELLHCHLAKLPALPHTLNAQIPPPLSAIVLKLMAKNAEDRYQSALGLKHDLERCQTQWNETGSIAPFELGQQDRNDRFLIPEKLYGREAEVQTLLDAFDRVAQGHSELILVAGFSGIGKTAVVNEVHKPITQQHGYFIKGKFDQFNRNIPFSAFVQAFRSLMGQLLGESDDDLAQWKSKILETVGDNGQVLIEVIPELERIIGPQPTVPELSGLAVQNRFNRLFCKFIQVFTTPKHPLTIFLDDLQWIDSASLSLLKLLMDQSENGYLLVLGTYRDNEVYEAHPLKLSLKQLQHQRAPIQTLTLKPLGQTEVNQLVADTLLCQQEVTALFSELIYQKTQGNPFFTTQFLLGLYGDGHIAFEPESGYWRCDLTQVRALVLTDDVVKFMVGRLQKLPDATQTLLKLAACLGNRFNLETLSLVCDRAPEAVAVDLWQSLQEGLVLPESEVYKFFQGEHQGLKQPSEMALTYRFLHDRVQQAAYGLIPVQEQPSTHLQIGRTLFEHLSEAELDTKLFDVVNHWDAGTKELATATEKQQLCQLNLRAGEKAKRAIAYAMAYQYANTALELLEQDSWETDYPLTLSVHNLLVETAYLSGNFEQVEHWTMQVLQHSQTILDAIKAYDIRILARVSQKQFLAAIALGRQVLQHLEVSIPVEPTPQDIQASLATTADLVPHHAIQSLADLPMMTDSRALAALQILNSIAVSVYLAQPELFPLIVLAQVKLSILHGNAPISAGAYARYSLVLCGTVNDLESGYAFGQLALELSEQFGNRETNTRVLLMVGALTLPWKQHLRDAIPLLKQAYLDGIETGNLEPAALSHYYETQSAYLIGHELRDLERQAQLYSEHIRQAKQEVHLNNNELLRQVLLNLIGDQENQTPEPWILSGEAFDEATMLPQYQSSNNLLGLFCFHLHKMMLCYWFNQLDHAVLHSDQAVNYLSGATAQATVPLFYFYDALIQLSQYASETERESNTIKQLKSEQESYLKSVQESKIKLRRWSEFSPINFQHRLDLIEAEHYSALGHKLEAIESYERAISGAKNNGYLQEEALANERAALFYRNWGKEKIAASYMQDAYYCYARWGTQTKTDDLKQRYPQLLHPILHPSSTGSSSLDSLSHITKTKISVHSTSTSTSASTGSQTDLDLATVLTAAQLLSESIQLDELLGKLAQIMLQNSGADRLALLLPQPHDTWSVRVSATSEGTQLISTPLMTSVDLPIQLIQYVKRTQEILAVENPETDLPIRDAYLQQHQPRSVLCVPILYQSKPNGLLYLQNQSTAGVFNHDRITIINFLCSQAAIALENARLYALEQEKSAKLIASEAWLDTLFQEAADAVFLFTKDGFIDCNQATLDSFGCADKSHFLAMSFDALSPEFQPNGQRSRDRSAVIMQDVSIAGKKCFEWVHQRSDGEQFWADVMLTAIDNGEQQIIHAVIRDISQRKAMERELAFSKFSFEHASDAIFCTNRQGKIVDVNQSACERLGYSYSELCRLSILDLSIRFSQNDWSAYWEELKQKGSIVTESQLRTKAGEIFPIEVVCNSLEFSGEEYVFSIARDISDRKRVEAEQQRQLDILESASDFIGTCDPNGKILYLNRAWRKILQKNTNTPIDRVVISEQHPAWAQSIILNEALPQSARCGMWLGETALLDINQQEIPVSQLVIAHKNSHGEVEYFSTIARDISDRKTYEQKILESQTFLQTVLDTFPLSVFWKDRESRYIGVNRNFARDAGLSCTEDIVGLTDFDLPWTKAEAEAYRADDQEVMQSDAPKLGIIETLVQADGIQLWLETNKLPLHDLDGNVIGVMGTYQDISIRKLAEEKLRQSNIELEEANQKLIRATQLKDEFLANMSHELRTPLNSVIGFSQLMQRDSSLPEKHQETLSTINRSGEYLLSLINDILEMSKIEAGQTTLNLEPVNLPQLLDELKDILQLKADAKGLNFYFIYSTEIPIYIEADEVKLRQILLNLLGNALKFTQQGNVSFRAKVMKSDTTSASAPNPSNEKVHLQFAVTDTGPGISSENQDAIFQPFIQSSAGKHSNQGTGLGLPISRKFAQTMGGNIYIDSVLGQGSTFYCDIFVHASTSQNRDNATSHKRYEGIQGIKDTHTRYRILVVDDNQDNRTLLCQMLSLIGIEVEAAVNGLEAVKQNESWQPHLIWMDIRMPVMDGLEATRQIRQSSHQPKIIAITANAFEDEREIALEAGCDDFVSKPFSMNEIFERIERWLEVEFICEPKPSQREGPESMSGSRSQSDERMIQAGLRTMPIAWQKALQKSVNSLNGEAVTALLAKVPEEQKAMVVAIAALQKNYRYDILIEILKTIESEN